MIIYDNLSLKEIWNLVQMMLDPEKDYAIKGWGNGNCCFYIDAEPQPFVFRYNNQWAANETFEEVSGWLKGNRKIDKLRIKDGIPLAPPPLPPENAIIGFFKRLWRWHFKGYYQRKALLAEIRTRKTVIKL